LKAKSIPACFLAGPAPKTKASTVRSIQAKFDIKFVGLNIEEGCSKSVLNQSSTIKKIENSEFSKPADGWIFHQ
jgi:hypothetical protein